MGMSNKIPSRNCKALIGHVVPCSFFFRKHMPASSSGMGNSFEYAVMHSSFSSPGRGHASLEASGTVSRNTRMSIDALGSQTLGFGFPLSLTNSNFPIRFPPLDPSELFLQKLRDFISERHGVLEDGWRVEFKQPLNGYHLCAVYCSPSGKTFSSIQDVACYLGLAIDGNYSCIDAEIRNANSILQEQLHIPKRRKTSRWPNNIFPEQKGSSVSAQLRRFPFNGQMLPPCTIKSGILFQGSESLTSRNNGCGREETNIRLPIQFEDFFVLSLGQIDMRHPYHNTNMIYPIGYKSCWHDKVTGSLFTCEVSDGSSGPVFKVTRSPCSKSCIPTGSTVFSCPKIDEMVGQNIEKRGDHRDSTQEHDDINVEILLSEPDPPLGDDILSCLREKNFSKINCLRSEVGSSQVDFEKMLSYNQEYEVEIGNIVVEEASLSVAWKKVSQKLVDACSSVLKQKGTINFLCKHTGSETKVINWDMMNEKDTVILSLSRFCCSLAPHNVVCGEKDKSKIATLVDALSRWLDQNRYGLDADFVQEMIEQMPCAESCTNYRTLKSRSSSSVPVTVEEGALVVKPQGRENVKEEVFGEISWKAKKHNLNGGHGVSNPDPPPGRPMCLRLPPRLIGDFLQVFEVFWRFHEILGLEEAFSPEKLEQELISPVFLGKSGKEDNRSEMKVCDKDSTATKLFSLFNDSCQPSSENTYASALKDAKAGDSSDFNIPYSSHGLCLGSLVSRTHISLLQVLLCELQSKVAAFVDPNFDSGESRSRRGRKKDDSTLSAKRNKLHMLPVNEVTWPELARRYILSLLSMDGNLESSEIAARESGKVFLCLQGDGGLLCGSLTGVAGMEADSMLLAEAIKKIYGSLTREDDIITVEDDDSDGLNTAERNTCNGDIPEWAQVLQPVKKLPTNVGTRIRKCVYEALERNPPEWAKKILEHSISKEVYKGNASGPTKKAVLSVLADIQGGDLVQRSVKGTKKRTSIVLSDIIMKKCRAVLRGVAAADEDKVVCTLLGRKLLNSSDNDDDGLLGSPAMVSRPLDFRTIDLRLAAGAYYGSTESFLEDVLELWSSIRAMYADQPNCLELVDTLSEKFKSLYESEVRPLVQKLIDYRNLECLSADKKKEIKDVIASVNKLPKAPWDEGVCKVCGVDKDDDSVLLCDTCDAEYHTYCLNPPLIRIPDGNWYCPSCVIAKRMAQDALESYKLVRGRKGRKYQGELTRASMEMTAHLADVMEEKDYWDFGAEEKIFLLKLLCDEILSTSLVRQHLEQCAEAINEMQQKLRALSSDWKNAKLRQEFLTAKLAQIEPSILKEVGEPQNSSHFADLMVCDQRQQEDVGDRVTRDEETSTTASILKKQGKAPPETFAQELHVNSGESKISSTEKVASSGRHELLIADTSHLVVNLSCEKDTLETLHKSVESDHETHDASSQASRELQACQQDLNATSNEIQNLQRSIRSIESQLLKQSLRRDFLGSDASGRLYWGCCFPEEIPRVLVDGNISLQKSGQADLTGSKAPSSFLHGIDHRRQMLSTWTYYETEAEISELVQWFNDDDAKERDLRESILSWKRLRCGDVQTERKQAQDSPSSILDSGLVTKAAMSMEKRYGPCIKLETKALKKRGKKTKVAEPEKLCRCECLESILPSMIHCLICHKTFSSDIEFEEHTESKCIPYSLATEGKEISDSSKAKESTKSDYSNIKSSGEKDRAEKSNVSELDSGLIRYQEEESISPYQFEEICSKFVTKDSNRDLINEIGLIGSNGIPTFLPSPFTHLNDSMLISTTTSNLDGGDSGDQVNCTGSEVNVEGLTTESNMSCDRTKELGSPLNKPSGMVFGFSEQKNKKSSGSGLKVCCVVPQASLKRITGKSVPVFRFLKTSLLDMDVALPEEALRPSKSYPDRRRAWRAFVKSAQSIYELVQATIVMEDMIRREYLKNEWWYWSSLSAAAKTSTLSALSVRIFSLDAAIIYDKPITPSDPTDETKPISLTDHNKSQIVSDSQERSSRSNRRSGKKRKEPEGP